MIQPRDPALIAAALENPGGWVYDIDWVYRDEVRVPPEAIRGAWRVDPDGRLTTAFEANPRHRPVINSTRKPAPYMIAAAKHLHDEWMVEIDPSAEHLFPDIPESKRVGSWYVDQNGQLTGQFRASSLYDGDIDQRL